MQVLTEKEAEDFLEKHGFEVIPRQIIKNKKELDSVAKKISFPWAMKASSKKLVHKAKLGGVLLNIKGIKDAEKALAKLSKIGGFEECMIQPMMAGESTILGLKKTPEFGMTIMFGMGGSNVEQEKDVSFRVLPITEKDAEEMIKDVKFYNVLKEKKVNLELIKKNLMKLQSLSKKYKNIIELDINPLAVTGSEAKVIDARIVFE